MPSLYLHVAVHFLQSRALAVPARAVMKIIASLDSIVLEKSCFALLVLENVRL
jgi:hypothetical protein